MTVDTNSAAQGWLADLRASLEQDLAVQTARLKELTELTADTGDPGEAHTQAALLAATRHSVERITGALRRIAEGRYGRCERCDAQIPPERLEVLPHARYCVPCQQKHNG
ncbi:TraR/DksA family transcriptional regulator [Plantactinospora sp. GCM10030261]|uniref:TraR/DksA family transcriptional regulator n=1 Tax=Plantactinospora sp. GCM10030261 TaxID=3273420 RepID=UPI00361CF0BA